jgi:hypothetical protein
MCCTEVILFWLDESRSLWVKDGLAIQPQRGPLSAVAPISEKLGHSLFVRKVPEAVMADVTRLYPN